MRSDLVNRVRRLRGRAAATYRRQNSKSKRKTIADVPPKGRKKIIPDDLVACAIFLSFIYLFVERLIGITAVKFVKLDGIAEYFLDPKTISLGGADPLPGVLAFCLIISITFVWVEDSDDGFRKLVHALSNGLDKVFQQEKAVWFVLLFVALYFLGIFLSILKFELMVSLIVLGGALFLFYCYYQADGFVIKFSIMFSLLFIMVSMWMSAYILLSDSKVQKMNTWMRGDHWYVQEDIKIITSANATIAGDFVYMTDDDIVVRSGVKRIAVPRSSIQWSELNELSGSKHATAH